MDSLKAIQDGFLRKAPVYLKMGALLFLIIVLLIPINMIDNMIGERRYRQAEVVGEVSGMWGREQMTEAERAALRAFTENHQPAEDMEE